MYQATNGWPQLATGAALAEQNGAEMRVMVFVVPLVMVGPLLAPVWVTGLIVLFRDRGLRWLAVAMVVIMLLTVASGSQPYSHCGVYAAVFAIGTVVVTRLAHGPGCAAGRSPPPP